MVSSLELQLVSTSWVTPVTTREWSVLLKIFRKTKPSALPPDSRRDEQICQNITIVLPGGILMPENFSPHDTYLIR